MTMDLGKRPTLALLAALIAFNLVLRYPRSAHEIGVDSFFIHVLAGSILADGHAEWILNPLSYFGWYPLSYPSAGPFFLAALSETSGLNLEATILLVSLALGPIGILGAFAMAREFRRNAIFALSVSLIYGLAPRFLAFTLWSASTRNLFMALLPIVIWALLRNYRKASLSNGLILTLSFMMLAATHRLVVLMVAVMIAFLLAIMLVVVARILRIRFPTIVLRNSTRRIAPHLVLAVVVGVAVAMLGTTDVLSQYSEGEFGSGNNLQTQLVNLGVSIARSGGLALPLILVGLVVVTRERNKTIGEAFLALSLIALVPTLSLRQYTGFYILPFLAIFGGLGFVGLVKFTARRPKVAPAVALALVVSVSGFSAFVLNLEIERSAELDPETYTTALYVHEFDPPGSVIANEGLSGIRVAAISGSSVLPVGGAGTTFQSPELLAYGFYTGDEVDRQVVKMDLYSVTIESDSLWVATGIQAELDWVMILESPHGAISNRLMQRYEPAVYLELDSAPGEFLAYDNRYCSDLGRTLRQTGYRIYDNGYLSVWWLHSPGITTQPGAPAPCP